MKSVNRKILMALTSVAIALAFIAIASVVGVHAAALADSVRADMFCLGLALASVAVRIANAHMALEPETTWGHLGSSGNANLRKSSVIGPRY
ncbi:MAG TPA: hypothetical protein VMS31_06835 [Pyrinomonadaceae bacterium]|nr:hypothetical protein [Pyrinomonadaceae bacterium]